MKEVARGAEAVLYRDGGRLVKERVPKGYRRKELDETLRKARTRREAKVLEKLASAGVSVPRLLSCDGESVIEMDFVEGEKVRDVLDALPMKEALALCEEIGEGVGRMHSLNVIHGDLTTSNFLVSGGRVVFVDFGLSFHSLKAEDKAVDLHLLFESLNSKHYLIAVKCFEACLAGYKKTDASDYPSVAARLDKVESRGRYKAKARQSNRCPTKKREGGEAD